VPTAESSSIFLDAIEEALWNAGKAVRPRAKRQLRTARNCSDSVEALRIPWL
jgi:hypothetical protein